MDVVKNRYGKDLRQSDEYANFMSRIGWQIPEIPKSKFQMFIKRFGFLTVAKIRRAREITDWGELKNILNKYRINMCRIDPETADVKEYKNNGFKLEKNQMVATKTLLLDLTGSENELLMEFKTETRRKLKRDVNYEIRNMNNFDEFYEILKNGYREIDVWCPSKSEYQALIDSFEKKCFCVTIDNKAGCLVIIHKQVAEYYYASATKMGKAENLPYVIAWMAINEARHRGAKVWDWNGLYDDRYPENRYIGFSFFKKRFGGVEMEFPGGFLGWRLLGHW